MSVTVMSVDAHNTHRMHHTDRIIQGTVVGMCQSGERMPCNCCSSGAATYISSYLQVNALVCLTALKTMTCIKDLCALCSKWTKRHNNFLAKNVNSKI